MDSLKKGDVVQFIPQYKDGEVEFNYVLLEDPDGDTVKVMPISTGLEIPPNQVVIRHYLRINTNPPDKQWVLVFSVAYCEVVEV